MRVERRCSSTRNCSASLAIALGTRLEVARRHEGSKTRRRGEETMRNLLWFSLVFALGLGVLALAGCTLK